jgi:uncharacterized protein (TIGR02147 family)
MTVDDFVDDPRWIARALGITVSEVNFAIERLIRLGILRADADGALTRVTKDLSTIGTAATSAAHRRLQAQILQQAQEALETVPVERRDQSTMTMAIDPQLLPRAREMTREFRRGLCAFLQSSGRLTEVYQLSVSLFPLTAIGPDPDKPGASSQG